MPVRLSTCKWVGIFNMFACVYLGTNTCNNYVSATALLGRSHTLKRRHVHRARYCSCTQEKNGTFCLNNTNFRQQYILLSPPFYMTILAGTYV